MSRELLFPKTPGFRGALAGFRLPASTNEQLELEASATCLADSDGGGESICSVNLRGQTPFLHLLFSLKLWLPRTRLECQARALNLARCSTPVQLPGCQPSVCAAVQLPCHHHYHQSELRSCLSVSLCVFAADNGSTFHLFYLLLLYEHFLLA